jgi:hypothetical protein
MRKRKRKEEKRLFHPADWLTELRKWGERICIQKYLEVFLILYGSMAVLSYIYKLRMQYVIVVFGVTTCFVPGITAIIHRNNFEMKKFEDISAYMEQLLYSFKRRAKILSALEDTLLLFEKTESSLHDAVSEAVYFIQSEQAKNNIYKEAFSYIEKEYGCARLYKIHDFLMESEAVGGDYTRSANILLNDRKLWVDRVYEMQREKKNVKIKITIGIALSFLICTMTVHMLPDEFGITEQAISQSATTVTMLLNLLIWYIAQRKLSKSLLEGEAKIQSEEIKRRYDYVMYSDLVKEKRKVFFAGTFLFPAVLLLLWHGRITAAGVTGILIIFILTHPQRHYKISMKYVRREIEKVFPEWLIRMSLHLQTDNVHVSISKSIERAPEIMRSELTGLQHAIEGRPDSVVPYLNFMNKLHLPDITSAMKILYSMAEFGASDIDQQIGPLVERSAVMTDKAERLKTEDYLAAVSFLVLLPMITGVIKMLADLVLVLLYILSTINHIT